VTGHFTTMDAAVLLAYVAGVTLLGLWLGRHQCSPRDYFVASGDIPWWAVLVSIVATETSAITFISIPGLAYVGDLGFLQITVGYLLGRMVVAWLFLPRYFEGRLLTAYALLEERFGVATRRMASITFMVTRALADSVRIFATAIPLALILGPLLETQRASQLAILLIGAFTLLYTYHGGIRAVVWTDVVQSGVYVLGGVAALILLGRGVDGGWPAILQLAAGEGKLRIFDFSLTLSKPHTIFAGLLGGAFLAMASHGADQLIVQRLLAARELKGARLALVGSGLAVILQFALFLFVGLGLYAFYQGRQFSRPDEIFPTFILEGMPPGMTGLVVAAILAAAMSTVSSSLNSLAAASTHDIYEPLTGASGARSYRAGRVFTLLWAVVLIGTALLYPSRNTPVVVVALSIASFTYGGLLGSFVLGILWRPASQADAMVAMAVGIVAMALVVFAGPLATAIPWLAALQPLSTIAWPWYVLIGVLITVLTGMSRSLFESLLRSRPKSWRGGEA
jgi:SSS family solute:Na+ symporter